MLGFYFDFALAFISLALINKCYIRNVVFGFIHSSRMSDGIPYVADLTQVIETAHAVVKGEGGGRGAKKPNNYL